MEQTCSQHFTRMNSFTLQTALRQRNYYYPLFTDEQTGAQGCRVTCPRRRDQEARLLSSLQTLPASGRRGPEPPHQEAGRGQGWSAQSSHRIGAMLPVPPHPAHCPSAPPAPETQPRVRVSAPQHSITLTHKSSPSATPAPTARPI